ncbi:hypothetical protein IR117_02870 [Streptococcus danieliae]|nr:hypothetical protein [Streptococcus danieliae]
MEEEGPNLLQYQLTAENWDQIDPLIGLTEADLTEFFGNHKTAPDSDSPS